MGSKIERFEDFEVWKSAMSLAVTIYKKTSGLKDYYLRDQINRAALSISNNIAEGFEYNNNGDFLRFLKFAKGSCGEVRSMLYLFKETGLFNQSDFEMLLDKTETLSKQIKSLMKYLRSSSTVPKSKSTEIKKVEEQ